MKKQESKSVDEEKDWTQVLFEIIIKILTLGFYHIEKHKKIGGIPPRTEHILLTHPPIMADTKQTLNHHGSSRMG